MSDKTEPKGPGSRIIRERAMAVLRETRSKIDPALLAVMKEKLSSVVPQGMGLTQAATVKPPAEPKPDVYPAAKFSDAPAVPLTEAVDKQKIAQIVLQYMKNRQETQKH